MAQELTFSRDQNIAQRPTLAGKFLKISRERESDFDQISDCEFENFRARKMQFHTPSHDVMFPGQKTMLSEPVRECNFGVPRCSYNIIYY